MARLRKQATCHPDKPNHSYGLCRACYATQGRRLRGVIPRPTRLISCHPEKKYGAHGLCQNCYTAARKATLPPSLCHPEKPAYVGDTCRSCYVAAKTCGISKNAVLAIRASPCGICGETDGICIDHNHTTGAVRGSLCRDCNFVVGFVEKHVTLKPSILLQRVVSWLEKDKC